MQKHGAFQGISVGSFVSYSSTMIEVLFALKEIPIMVLSLRRIPQWILRMIIVRFRFPSSSIPNPFMALL